MSENARSSILVPVALVSALAAIGAGAFFLLRATPEAPAPVVAAPVEQAATAPAPAPVVTAPAPAPLGVEFVAGRVLRGAEGEEIVAGAAIEVYAADGGPVPFLAPLVKGESGADGKFQVGGLAKDASYRVLASREGLAPAVVLATAAGASVDIRLLAALPAAGTVQDAETKEPVAGARVVAGGAVGTTTGPDGAWRLERVPAEGGVVTASARGFVPKTRALRANGKGRDAILIRLAPASTVAGIVLGPDGKPAVGADVTLHQYYEAPSIGRVETESKGVKSGADGTFLFEEVPLAKALDVSASSPEGFAPSVAAGPLQRGQPAAGIELRIAAAATLVVTVLDEGGKPVEGATVSDEAVVEKGDGDAETSPGAAFAMARAARAAGDRGGTTDAAGIARIRPVPAGKTKVTAEKDDFLKAEETVDAPAAAETAVTLRLAPGIAVTGKVVDGEGNPVAEADVTAMRYRGKDFVHESRKTGTDGVFLVGGLAGKGFDLSAAKAGYVTANQAKVDPAAGPLTLVLQKSGGLTGVAVDEAGKPLPEFSVSTKRTDVKEKSNPMGFMFDAGGTEFKDEAGKFKMEDIAPGTYTVTVKAEGLAPGRVADVRIESGATADVRVVVPAGLSIRGVVLRKGDETPVAGASVSIAGGGPFGGMDMDIDMDGMVGAGDEDDPDSTAEIREAMSGMFGGGKGSATTDAEGKFLLKGLEAGKVAIKVKAKDLAPTTQKGVAVPADAEVRILVSEGGAIEGTVVDALRVPKAGMTVMLQKIPFTMKMATTDARGHYRIAGVAPGKYLFYVVDKGAGMFPGMGGGMKSESVTLEDGRTLVKDHRLGDGTKLVGKVTRAGKPVGGVMVVLLPGAGRKDATSAMLGGSGFAMATTKEDGSYEIPGVAPGTYTALVQVGMGGSPAPGDAVEIPASAAEVRRDIAMARNSLRGVVVDAAGEPVEGVQVHAVASGKSASRAADLGEAVASMGGQAMSGPDGKFEMEDMNAGSYTLQAAAEGKGTAIVENVAPTEGGTEVRVVLVPGVEVTVKVLDADGKPVSGAGIYLTDSRGIDLTGLEMFDVERTGDDGKAVVAAPPGSIHFEAVVAGHAPGTTTATAAAGAEVVITLPKAAAVDVLVTDAAGAPRSGVQVRLLDAAGNPYAPRVTMEGIGDLMSAPTTGTDGRFHRGDLPAGTWTVRALVGDSFADAKVTLAAGERKPVTVRLP